jgi:hypothetical protein
MNAKRICRRFFGRGLKGTLALVVRGFIGFLFITWVLLGSWLCLHSEYGWGEAVRIVAINVTSVVTTTGVALGGNN